MSCYTVTYSAYSTDRIYFRISGTIGTGLLLAGVPLISIELKFPLKSSFVNQGRLPWVLQLCMHRLGDSLWGFIGLHSLAFAFALKTYLIFREEAPSHTTTVVYFRYVQYITTQIHKNHTANCVRTPDDTNRPKFRLLDTISVAWWTWKRKPLWYWTV